MKEKFPVTMRDVIQLLLEDVYKLHLNDDQLGTIGPTIDVARQVLAGARSDGPSVVVTWPEQKLYGEDASNDVVSIGIAGIKRRDSER